MVLLTPGEVSAVAVTALDQDQDTDNSVVGESGVTVSEYI